MCPGALEIIVLSAVIAVFYSFPSEFHARSLLCDATRCYMCEESQMATRLPE